MRAISDIIPNPINSGGEDLSMSKRSEFVTNKAEQELYRAMIENGPPMMNFHRAPDGELFCTFANTKFEELLSGLGLSALSFIENYISPRLNLSLPQGSSQSIDISLPTGRAFNLQVVNHVVGVEYLVSIVDISQQTEFISQMRYANMQENERRKLELTELVHGIGHDFKEPLTSAIVGLSVLLSYPQKFGLGAEAVEKLNKVYESTKDQNNRVVQLVDFLRNEAELLKYKPMLVSPMALFQEIVSELSDKDSVKDVAIVCDLDRLPSYVTCDPNVLYVIVNNLMSNALKFGANQVSLSAQYVDGAIEIIVMDNGVGIPTEFWPNMYKLFSRAENGKSLVREGTGLGLAMVRNTIDKCNGKIRFLTDTSAEQHGTSFTVSIPLAPIAY